MNTGERLDLIRWLLSDGERGTPPYSAVWHPAAAEPKWYYDLHPVARELLADHGEVPLLLSRHLRSTARRYDDVPELELRDASDKPVAEADLVAVGNDEVIVAEAKSNDALGKNPREVKRAAAKRVMLADVLRADQIILATTQPEWNTSSLTEIRRRSPGTHGPRDYGPLSASSPGSAATRSRTCDSILRPEPQPNGARATAW
jgi:hypothetical protein